MKRDRLASNLLLLFISAIWGFAFTAQRTGANYIGAFMFNGIRFGLGAISLIPLIFYLDKKNLRDKKEIIPLKKTIIPGGIIGLVLYLGASVQQIGILYTTVGKASFITGLYVFFVPMIGIFLKHKISKNTWIGITISVVGLYLLSVNENFNIAYGDVLQLVSAIFWAIHILTIDYFSNKLDALKLSCIQFATCSILSFITSSIFEKTTLSGLNGALTPVLYGGLLSVGVGYTLQVVVQKKANPSDAAIIFSLESVFGALGGMILLGESMSLKAYIGCTLIFLGIVLSQIKFKEKIKKEAMN